MGLTFALGVKCKRVRIFWCHEPVLVSWARKSMVLIMKCLDGCLEEMYLSGEVSLRRHMSSDVRCAKTQCKSGVEAH